MNTTSKNVDQYIAQFPQDIQFVLQNIRTIIKQAAPDAEEIISYQMPAYKQNGMLVYFAANKNHLGFYPTSSGIDNFKDELQWYRTGRGSIQFPYNKPIPFELIAKIVIFKVEENKLKFQKRKQ